MILSQIAKNRWRPVLFSLVFSVNYFIVNAATMGGNSGIGNSNVPPPPGISNDSTDQMVPLSLSNLFNLEVVTSSRKAEARDEAPNVIYSISKEEIRKYGYRSIKDILNRLPGFFTSFNPIEPVAQIRGIAPNENNKITYMINGHRVNNLDESTDLVAPYNLDNCERVEVIVGPGSMLYGPETSCATVNMITKEIVGEEVVGSYGQENTGMVTGMAGVKPYEDVSLFGSCTYAQSDGWDSKGFYRHSGEKIAGESGDVLSRHIGTIRPSGFFFGNAQVRGMNVQFSSLNQAMPEYSQNREAFSKIATRFNYVDAFEISKTFAFTKAWSMLLQTSLDSRRMLRAIESAPSNDVGTILDVSDKLYKCEVGGSYESHNSYLQFGFQGRMANNRHNYSISHINPIEPDTIGTVEQLVAPGETYVVGGYLSEKFKIKDFITLVGGLRADYSNLCVERRDTNSINIYYSPRFALIAKPLNDLILKAMYNTATKFPEPWESRFNQLWNFDRGVSWADSVMGTAYKPERLTAYEIQTIYYLHFLGESRFALNGYYQTLNDFIGWGKSFSNIGDYAGYGAELDVRYIPNENLQFWGNLATNFNHFTPFDTGADHGSLINPDSEINAVPRLTGTFGGEYNFFHKTMHLTATVSAFTHQVARTYPLPDYVMSTDQMKAYANSNFKWTYINNIAYLDLAYCWDKVFIENLGLRLSCKNVLDDENRVALQYANGDYQPQGRYLEATLFLKF